MKGTDFKEMWRRFAAQTQIGAGDAERTLHILGAASGSNQTSPLGDFLKANWPQEGQIKYQMEDGKIDLSVATKDAFLNVFSMHEKEGNKHGVATDYPIGYPLLLECENETATAYQEMIKLTYYRSPLKVLVCYDYGHDVRWAYAKKRLVENFHAIISQTNGWFGENPRTEYVLVMGTNQPSQSLLWSYAVFSFREGDVVVEEFE